MNNEITLHTVQHRADPKKVKVGQFYKRDGGLFDGQIFIVTSGHTPSNETVYGLQALNDGKPWHTLCRCIEDVFANDAHGFIKVDDHFTVAPKL